MKKRQITRRDFLKTTATLGIVGMLPNTYATSKVYAASMGEDVMTEVGIEVIQNAQITATIAAEIEQEKAILFEIVYRQLEQQNATGMMPLYEEILTSEIEKEVKDRYSQRSEDEIMGTTTTLTKGGIVAYTTSAGAQVATTYLLNTQTGSYQVGTVFDAVMSYLAGELMGLGKNWIPGINHVLFVYRALMLVHTVLSIVQWQNALGGANGFVRIMNVQDASGVEKSSAVLPWTNYKRAYVPSTSEASSIVVNPFVNTVFAN